MMVVGGVVKPDEGGARGPALDSARSGRHAARPRYCGDDYVVGAGAAAVAGRRLGTRSTMLAVSSA